MSADNRRPERIPIMSSWATLVSMACASREASRRDGGAMSPMRRVYRVAGVALLAGTLASGSVAAAESTDATGPRQRCVAVAELMKAKWPDATTHVLTAAWHPAGEQIRTPMGPAVLPEHCEITAAMQDRVGRDGQHYAVRFHLRLPASWNQRFFFEGGGGTEGELGGAI